MIPVDVEDLDEVRPVPSRKSELKTEDCNKKKDFSKEFDNKSKGSGDLQDDEQKHRSRPPLPSSPSSQRKPPPKETAPSIRIMIQRYNKKINEEGNIFRLVSVSWLYCR